MTSQHLKGKKATKGSKQIAEENIATLAFYKHMILGSLTGFILINSLLFEFTTLVVFMSVISLGTLFAAYQFMSFMSRPKSSPGGVIIDSGTDLNTEGGIAEHVKDLIILTSATLLLSLISNYFWLLLLLAPCQAAWKFWINIIKPRLIQSNENESEEKKKNVKLKRK